MKEPRLDLFDLIGLKKGLNAALDDSEDTILLGEFDHEKPGRNPFWNKIADRELEARGSFPLFQEYSGLLSLFGMDFYPQVGHLSVEAGYTDASSEYGGRYENLQLRLWHPLGLRNGLVIPNCSIKISAETEEDGIAELSVKRSDHVRRLGLFWIRDDLSKILPTALFMRESKTSSQTNRAKSAK